MGLTIPCPDYSLICRRASKVQIPLQHLQSSEFLHVAFDSTVLKVYPEDARKLSPKGLSFLASSG
ncbi:MAG: transposase [Chlamydiales bacterium]|nr:transposase [Chlamydiales bacterium]